MHSLAAADKHEGHKHVLKGTRSKQGLTSRYTLEKLPTEWVPDYRNFIRERMEISTQQFNAEEKMFLNTIDWDLRVDVKQFVTMTVLLQKNEMCPSLYPLILRDK